MNGDERSCVDLVATTNRSGALIRPRAAPQATRIIPTIPCDPPPAYRHKVLRSRAAACRVSLSADSVGWGGAARA